MTSLLILSMLAVPPIYAKKGGVEYKANGKLVTYGEGMSETSEVVNGRWSVKVKDGMVDFLGSNQHRIRHAFISARADPNEKHNHEVDPEGIGGIKQDK